MDTLTILVVFVVLCLIFFSPVIFSLHGENRGKREELDESETARIEQERQREERFKEEIDKLSNEYGTIIRQFDFGTKDINACILVFAEAEKVWAFGRIYNFNQFIGCNIKDNLQIEKSSVTYKTKTSTSSMLGRAIVGGVLTGGIGALVGGATAKKKTVAVPSGNDKTIHDFTVVINTNDLSCPIFYVKCGTDELLANELHGIINAIISKNIHN